MRSSIQLVLGVALSGFALYMMVSSLRLLEMQVPDAMAARLAVGVLFGIIAAAISCILLLITIQEEEHDAKYPRRDS